MASTGDDASHALPRRKIPRKVLNQTLIFLLPSATTMAMPGSSMRYSVEKTWQSSWSFDRAVREWSSSRHTTSC